MKKIFFVMMLSVWGLTVSASQSRKLPSGRSANWMEAARTQNWVQFINNTQRDLEQLLPKFLSAEGSLETDQQLYKDIRKDAEWAIEEFHQVISIPQKAAMKKSIALIDQQIEQQRLAWLRTNRPSIKWGPSAAQKTVGPSMASAHWHTAVQSKDWWKFIQNTQKTLEELVSKFSTLEGSSQANKQLYQDTKQDAVWIIDEFGKNISKPQKDAIENAIAAIDQQLVEPNYPAPSSSFSSFDQPITAAIPVEELDKLLATSLENKKFNAVEYTVSRGARITPALIDRARELLQQAQEKSDTAQVRALTEIVNLLK